MLLALYGVFANVCTFSVLCSIRLTFSIPRPYARCQSTRFNTHTNGGLPVHMLPSSLPFPSRSLPFAPSLCLARLARLAGRVGGLALWCGVVAARGQNLILQQLAMPEGSCVYVINASRRHRTAHSWISNAATASRQNACCSVVGAWLGHV